MADIKKGENKAQPAESKKWVEVSTERDVVSFEACEDANLSPVIEGYLVGVTRLKEETPEMPAFDCLEILLTKNVEIADKEGNKRTAEAGTEICVPRTARLVGLTDVALDPTNVYEVQISASGMKKISGNRSMRTYKVRRSPVPFKRAEVAPLTLSRIANEAMLFLPQAQTTNALPAGTPFD